MMAESPTPTNEKPQVLHVSLGDLIEILASLTVKINLFMKRFQSQCFIFVVTLSTTVVPAI